MTIADLQSDYDGRNLSIQRAGIRDYKHPIWVQDQSPELQPSVGTFSLMVSIPHQQKGTHMSRFVEILQESPVVLGVTEVPLLLEKIASRLHADSAYLDIQFPFFMTKMAPISKTKSMMNYEVSLSGALERGKATTMLKVVVPVTSLCPCSKAISEYGAHNQRSHIVVEAVLQAPIFIEPLIQAIEEQASCELFAILKRPDEKMVTERAYNNPKFVEDLVRDLANRLDQFEAIEHFTVESINFESIHNHSAYAMIHR